MTKQPLNLFFNYIFPRVSSSLSYKTNKWYAKVKPPKIGDLDIVYENYLRSTWPFNKIKEIYTDQIG